MILSKDFLAPRALVFADLLHQGEKKRGGPSRLTHLISVAWITSAYCDDPDVIAAALLHEAPDSPHFNAVDFSRSFNPRVLTLVGELRGGLNRKKSRLSWIKRKTKSLERFKDMSEAAQIIYTANKVHNLVSLVIDYQVNGETIWKKLPCTKSQLLGYHRDFFVLRTQFPHAISREYAEAYMEAEKVFGKEYLGNR